MTPPVPPSPGRSAVPPQVLPFAPILYVTWADGQLSPSELAALREGLCAAGLDEEGTARLAAWLDPDAPPSARELAALQEAVRASVGSGAARGLADLGEQIARAGGADEATARGIRVAIEGAEKALGIVGPEAARGLLPHAASPVAAGSGVADTASLRAWLDGGRAPVRARMFAVLSRPEFAYVDPHDIPAYREQVFAWCRQLAAEGFGSMAWAPEFGGDHDAANAIAAFETIAFHDLSLLIKFGVQFGLFGGSIWLLGTRTHHERWLRDAGTLALPGCFAMTETAHGSNVREIETTATYHPDTREFEIHTPGEGAVKDYIGNAAVHGRAATVFAQLVTRGERHGVHAFVVPIRDGEGRAMPGVRIEDCGPKEGLNGVDNGRLSFDRVRVPRDHLLDRWGGVTEDGTYASPIPSPGRRFFTMLGALVTGRIAIAAAALSASKSGLTIAVRYAAERRQFGPEGQPEVPILDYLLMQRSLLPRLAAAYVLDLSLQELVRSHVAGDGGDSDVEALAAGLKAWSSRHAVETLQACREACGGQGYLEKNRIAILKADTDVFTTFEGSNAVLLQLVARDLLTDYREQFGELRLWNVVRHFSGRAATAIAERNPVATRRSDEEHLRDPQFQLAALRYRENRLVDSLARRLRHRIEDGQDSFAALNECQDHAVAAATAAIERHMFERTRSAIDNGAPPEPALLDRLSSLFASWTIERHAAWYLEAGYIEASKARAIRTEINRLCREIRPDAVRLVNAFGIPDTLLAAPIALPDRFAPF